MTERTKVSESTYPTAANQLPTRVLEDGPYEVRFARDDQDLDRALALRYQVFNEELGEGLESSVETRRDTDEFDAWCHHLVVIDSRTAETVGTYRMQTAAMADKRLGFYSEGLFDLSTLPSAIRERSVEVGRACVARSHRSRLVLFLLWKGLALYVAHNQARYLFGCCSLTSQDPVEGWEAMRFLENGRCMHPDLAIAPQSEHVLPAVTGLDDEPDVTLPILFNTYLRFGSKVCGPPAIDREFKTIDFLVLMDVDTLSPSVHKMFFE